MKKHVIASLLICAPLMLGATASAEIKVGAIYDITGGLNLYGVYQSQGVQLAVDELNSKGGVLGEQVEVVTYDTQSELSKYTQYANTMVLRDKPSVVFAGLTSSSREAMRPVFRRANMPYFYGTLYEGGACDRQTFVTGPSASQQIKPLVEWAIKKYGPKMYIMAPDYNYGTISALWINEYAKQFGGEVVGEDFLALTVTDYSPTIQKIQRAKPDFVFAIPVGPSQVGFLEQFNSAGLRDSMGVVSSNYSNGNDQVILSKEAGKGIIASHVYFMSLDNSENKTFLEKWVAKYGETKAVSPEAVTAWNSVHLWAAAAEKAGTTKANALYAALETGDISFKGPNGMVTMEPGSHHLRQNIYLAEGNDDYGFKILETYENVAPSYENENCNLIENPKMVEHFTPDSK